MFHEKTDHELKRGNMRRLVVAACVVALAIVLGGVGFWAHENARNQGAVALRDSILNAAKQCCAIEGTYPKSIKHLEKDYGLTINHDDYVVSYEYFAGNVMPSVVVTPR